jgi:hypothetical protein
VRFLFWLANDRVQIGFNVVLGVVFTAMIPVSLISGLKNSVPFLVFLSLWALVAAHWGGALAAWAAKRAEAAVSANGSSGTPLEEVAVAPNPSLWLG